MTKSEATDMLHDNPTATFDASVAAKMVVAMRGDNEIDVDDLRAWFASRQGDCVSGTAVRDMASRTPSRIPNGIEGTSYRR